MRKWLLVGVGAAVVGVSASLVAPSFLKARPAAKVQDDGPANTQLAIRMPRISRVVFTVFMVVLLFL